MLTWRLLAVTDALIACARNQHAYGLLPFGVGRPPCWASSQIPFYICQTPTSFAFNVHSIVYLGCVSPYLNSWVSW